MGLDYKASIMYGYMYDTRKSFRDEREYDFHEDTEDPMSKEILKYLESRGCALHIRFDGQCNTVILYHNSTHVSWDPKQDSPVLERLDNITKGDAINSDLQDCKDFMYQYGLSTAKGGGKLSWWFSGEVW